MNNWYSLPTYYDVSFSHEMAEELAFLKKVFSQHCSGKSNRLFEPACGTGRLIIPLIQAGFDCTGFDLNEYALEYLKEKLSRKKLKANIFNGNMSDFNLSKKYDAAYCTVDTFRHILTEKQAEQHLVNVSKALKKNGIYILGLHIVTDKKNSNKVTRWTARRGRLTVNTSMTMLDLNDKKRIETLKVILNIRTKLQRNKYESVYELRTYSLQQLKKLISKTNVFEIISVYDHYYEFSKPVSLDNSLDYGVFILRKI